MSRKDREMGKDRERETKKGKKNLKEKRERKV